MKRYFLSVFPRTDLKFINSTACLKMTMNETESCDTFAAFQTMHFMKCCKWCHEHWTCSVRLQGDYLWYWLEGTWCCSGEDTMCIHNLHYLYILIIRGEDTMCIHNLHYLYILIIRSCVPYFISLPLCVYFWSFKSIQFILRSSDPGGVFRRRGYRTCQLGYINIYTKEATN
jgi:hypothetical protein